MDKLRVRRMRNAWEKKSQPVLIFVIVGTRFAAQAQGVWDLGPVSPIQ